MNIKITKRDGKYIADCTDLTGAPPIGTGKTLREAVGDLVLRLGHEDARGEIIKFDRIYCYRCKAGRS